MRPLILVLLISGLCSTLFAESTLKNYVFAHRDTCDLTMDVYTPANIHPNTPCLLFVFGGGFKMGSRTHNEKFFRTMADSGYVVSAIDYRLGMKGVKQKGMERINSVHKAIELAVEDLFSATGYLLKHTSELNIDPKMIIISGSSAGAVTVLHADYELSNRTALSSVLPENFHYAGVLSFAGGILSYNGVPAYKNSPAPTMFFHGMNDKLVNYDKIQILNKGFFGTNALVSIFEKNNYPYFAYRYRDMGHEIAVVPTKYNISDICGFIRDYVISHQKLKKDMTVKNPELKPSFYGKWKPKDIYK
ncbi:MAG: carboxylesterase family protein [Paludibacter sp.]